ncbi:MAG: hypothetical protein BroJett026_35320 [Betaproteobacteria bacterium]|nr:MAG: hypothetical protein BroJett026_35320 [Betaproteobacteria bacterium]
MSAEHSFRRSQLDHEGSHQQWLLMDANTRHTNPSDDFLADAFATRFACKFRYVPQLSTWLSWDGRRWERGGYPHVAEEIRRMIREITVMGEVDRSQVSTSQVSAVEKMARNDPRLLVEQDQLDADHLLLNTPSGLVDLRTGLCRPSDPEALCTKLTSAAWCPGEGEEIWKKFLREITQGDQEIEHYLQRAFGYASTGETREHVLICLHGDGSNGKSTFVEAIAHALGAYARPFAPEVLMESRVERHQTEIAQFDGMRLAYTSEPASSSTWNDSRIKSLTGDAVISARRMRQDQTSFPRTHKTVVLCNRLPRLSDTSHAIRRRVHVVDFNAVFETAPGESIGDKLKRECGGAILAWLAAGAREWMRAGTAPPACVVARSAEYVDQHDAVNRWARARCEPRPGGFEASAKLYGDFERWRAAAGEVYLSMKAFSMRLARIYEKGETSRANGFRGIALVEEGCGGSTDCDRLHHSSTTSEFEQPSTMLHLPGDGSGVGSETQLDEEVSR